MNKLKALIENAQTIAILGHISEDADSVGSCLAMCEALKNLGKAAVLYLSEPLEKRLSFIDEEMTVYSGEAKEYDLVICIDCGDIGRLGARRAIFDKAAHTANIDHHYTNTNFAEYNLVDADASAAGEILYPLFKKLGFEITASMAKNLYMAIASDTGSFKYSNVKPQTFEIAAALISHGIDHAEISRRLFDTESLEMLRFRGYLMHRVECFANGRLALVSVDEETFARFGISEKDMGDIVNIPRVVEGVSAAVALRCTADGRIKVSFRSNGGINVGEIALKFGGGGHEMAAGATLTLSLDEAKQQVIQAVEEVLNG